MLQRKRLFVGLAAVILLAAVGLMVVWIFVPPSLVTRANLDKIRFGMTEGEVVEILGPPSERRVGSLAWEGDEWVADIYFDEGRVSATMFGPQTSWLGKLRRWMMR